MPADGATRRSGTHRLVMGAAMSRRSRTATLNCWETLSRDAVNWRAVPYARRRRGRAEERRLPRGRWDVSPRGDESGVVRALTSTRVHATGAARSPCAPGEGRTDLWLKDGGRTQGAAVSPLRENQSRSGAGSLTEISRRRAARKIDRRTPRASAAARFPLSPRIRPAPGRGGPRPRPRAERWP